MSTRRVWVAVALFLVAMPSVSVASSAHAFPSRTGAGASAGRWPNALPFGWTNVTSALSPTNRSAAAMTYDAEDGYVLLFGGQGQNFAYLNDTWAYSQGNWTNLTSRVGRSPTGAASELMAYDATDGYVVLFQGSLGATWTYARGIWSQLSGSGPSPRWYSSMTYDARDGVVVLFGGSVGQNSPVNDTWSFAHGQWSNITATVGPAPPARWGAAMDYYPNLASGGGVVLFGGCNGTYLNDTWAFSGAHWSKVLTGSRAPTPRSEASMAWDAGDKGLIFVGGENATDRYNDSWFFYNSSWYTQNFSGISRRSFATLVEAPLEDGDVLFGGDYYGDLRGDTWEWRSFNDFPQLVVAVTASRSAIDIGGTVDLNATVYGWAGGNGIYQYWWSVLPPGCQRSNLSSIVCTPGSIGDWPVELAVNSSGNSTGSAVPLVVHVEPRLSAASPTVSPANSTVGETVALNTTVSGGTPPYTFRYTGLPAGCASIDSPTITCQPNAAGTFSISVNVSDAVGESVERSATLTVHNPATLSVHIAGAPPAPQVGQTVNLSALVSGGLGPFTYRWTLNGSATPLGTSPGILYVLTGSGRYNFTVTVTDALGASSSANTSVVLPATLPPLKVTISASATSIPSGGSLVLRASPSGGSGPYLMQWQMNGTNVSATGSVWTVRLVQPGEYTFSVFTADASGAHVVSNSVHVNVSAAPPGSNNATIPSTLLLGIGALLALAAVLLAVGLLRRWRKGSFTPSTKTDVTPPQSSVPTVGPSTPSTPGNEEKK